jgi:hypothetical protein
MAMTEQHMCGCCRRSVQIVNNNGLCFACNTFQTFATIIEEHTELTDEESLDLAGRSKNPFFLKLLTAYSCPVRTIR